MSITILAVFGMDSLQECEWRKGDVVQDNYGTGSIKKYQNDLDCLKISYIYD